MQVELPWYVAYTKVRQEQIAQKHLSQQSFQVYLPLMKGFKNKRGLALILQTVYEPMFPRYIFFQPFDASHSIASVRSTVGISDFVRFGGKIAQIKFETLKAIQQIEQEQHSGHFKDISAFKPGNKVVITKGTFDGLEGLISEVSEKRVMVLMQLLGRETKVTFNPAQLMAAV